MVAVFIVLTAIVGLAGWGASQGVLRVSKGYGLTLRLVDATDDTVTLPRRRETEAEGTYGLVWESHYAILGEIVKSSPQTVTRRIIKATDKLETDQPVLWNIFVYRGDPLRGLDLAYDEVSIPGDFGPLPAWFVQGHGPIWVLLVHGFRATREEGLRILPRLAHLGFPTLVLSYRNDPGAPRSPDNLYHLGDSEWKDIEAAVRYALSHGARDVVLYGWSMGGCIVETFLRRSPEAHLVRAVVLDSPILDWPKALDAQVRLLHLPHGFTSVLTWWIERRTGINFEELNGVHPGRARSIPTLLIHGTNDRQVPIVSSDVFAQERPDLITYHRVDGADHTQAWNVDARSYEDAVERFLIGLETRGVAEPIGDHRPD